MTVDCDTDKLSVIDSEALSDTDARPESSVDKDVLADVDASDTLPIVDSYDVLADSDAAINEFNSESSDADNVSPAAFLIDSA